MTKSHPDLWISNFGIRVTNLKRSLKFYNQLFDLKELDKGGDSNNKYVLLIDRKSGQRLELNWYSKKSPYYSKYIPGEGLDHIEVRVKDIPKMVERLSKLGIPLATRKLWFNKNSVKKLTHESWESKFVNKDVWVFPDGHRVIYVQDPDGNFIDFYDHPEEKWGGPIPDHY